MSLYYDNKQNRIFVRRNNQQSQQNQQNQQQSQFQPYFNQQTQQQQMQQQFQQHQQQFQQHQQQQQQQQLPNRINIRNDQNQNQNIDLNSNLYNENKINEGINVIDNLLQGQNPHHKKQLETTDNQNSLIELNIDEFVNKINKQNNVVEGPRGIPGLRGPQRTTWKYKFR